MDAAFDQVIRSGAELKNMEGDDLLDVRQLLRRLWQRRTWLAVATSVCIAGSVAYALLTDRIYRATTVLAVADIGGAASGDSILSQVGGLAAIAGLNVGNPGAKTEEALAVLRSRDFTVRFLQEEGVLQEFFRKDWDSEAKRWKSGNGPSISRAFAEFDAETRKIVQNRKTGLISMQIEWTDPVLAAKWANELVRRINEEMRLRAINDANASVRFLEKELESTSVVEVRQSINRLVEAQIKQRMLANVNLEYSFRIIDRAVVPEKDEAVRPHRRKIVMIGALLGMFLGALAIVLADYFKSDRKPKSS